MEVYGGEVEYVEKVGSSWNNSGSQRSDPLVHGLQHFKLQAEDSPDGYRGNPQMRKKSSTCKKGP